MPELPELRVFSGMAVLLVMGEAMDAEQAPL